MESAQDLPHVLQTRTARNTPERRLFRSKALRAAANESRGRRGHLRPELEEELEVELEGW